MLALPAHLYMPQLFTQIANACPPIIMCYVDVYCVFLIFFWLYFFVFCLSCGTVVYYLFVMLCLKKNIKLIKEGMLHNYARRQ